MNLYITAYGARLTAKQGSFQVKNEDKKERYSPKKIESICLTRACMVSTDAISLAIRNDIPIVMVSRRACPWGGCGAISIRVFLKFVSNKPYFPNRMKP